MSRETSSRKKDHVELCVQDRVAFRRVTTGLERVRFVHNALPEIDFEDVKTETMFLGKSVSMPLMISCMTGGYAEAERINRELAEVCAALRIPMGVGSQRQALENEAFHESFRIARKVAPNIPITANIGGAEVAKPEVRARLRRIVEMVEADALTVHLNPLQELMQPEGSPRFRGVLAGIAEICATLGIPVIVKEVGAGISADVAERLIGVGVAALDVAGAGGTSWAGVEIRRSETSPSPLHAYKEIFWDWGISTLDCLLALEELRSRRPETRQFLTVVASGGIASGTDVAKSLALGANFAAAARPFLQTLMEEGQNALATMIEGWRYQLRAALFLTGVPNVLRAREMAFRIEPAHTTT
jgi:isopentenyl-diphosphate delta-isomerase